MATGTIHEVLDIRQDTCPITFVKTKLKLEQMQAGEVLEVLLTGGEPLQNVPRSVKAEGHRIFKVENLGDNQYRLLIECGISRE
ncbi:MAG: sulfurtransferase TusA family protein [Clostridia bacterium]|nr:MAG: sulfurtransferase TusA family protein [Clostridia bacterium]